MESQPTLPFFGDWLFSQSMVFSRFAHVRGVSGWVCPFFLCLIASHCVSVDYIVSSPSSVGEHLGWFPLLAVMNNAAGTLVPKSSCGHMFSVPLGVHLGVLSAESYGKPLFNRLGSQTVLQSTAQVLRSHWPCMRPRVVLPG